MHEVFKAFMLSTIVITFWTAFILLQDKRGNRRLNCWFAAFLVALTTPQMDIYAGLVVPSGVWQLSLVASTFLWLKGPFLWIFVKVLTRQEALLRQVWPHFLPWAGALTLLLIHPQMGQWAMFLGMAHMLIYLFCTIGRLIIKRHYIVQLWVGFQNTAFYWLIYILAGLMLLVAIDFVVMSLVSLGRVANYSLLDFYVFPGFSVYVLSIGVLSVFRPELLFRVQPEAENNTITVEPSFFTADVAASAPPPHFEPKERYLALDPLLAKTLLQQLGCLMDEQKIYRQSELSLPGLAAALNISVHQVSELLNVHLGLGFYEYVNGFRLQHAGRLLRDPTCHLRVLDTAFEAGFNNKNSFYRAFKEGFGVTPSQYRGEALTLKTLQANGNPV